MCQQDEGREHGLGPSEPAGRLRTRLANSYSFLPAPHPNTHTEWIMGRTKMRAEFEEPALGCVHAVTLQDSAPHSSSATSTGL